MPVIVSVRTCSTDAGLQRSLEIYNAVWPHRATTAEDVAAWNQGALATAEFLGGVDGVDAGSAAAAFEASRTNLVAMLVTVLPQHRRAGVGSALVDAVTVWADEHGAREIEPDVPGAEDLLPPTFERFVAAHLHGAAISSRSPTAK